MSGADVEIAANARTDIGKRQRISGTQNGQDGGLFRVDVGLQDGGRDLFLGIARLERKQAEGQSRNVHTQTPTMLPRAYPGRVNEYWRASGISASGPVFRRGNRRTRAE